MRALWSDETGERSQCKQDHAHEPIAPRKGSSRNPFGGRSVPAVTKIGPAVWARPMTGLHREVAPKRSTGLCQLPPLG
jgi:hypothetical protein